MHIYIGNVAVLYVCGGLTGLHFLRCPRDLMDPPLNEILPFLLPSLHENTQR